jgi:hypothetical protein
LPPLEGKVRERPAVLLNLRHSSAAGCCSRRQAIALTRRSAA